ADVGDIGARGLGRRHLRSRRALLSIAAGLEARVHAPDALIERRMGIEEAGEAHLDALAEEEVRHLLRIAALDQRAAARRADLVERAGDALGVARELHARGVGEELALARHRCLDEPREEKP